MILRINAKVSDLCQTVLIDDDGLRIVDKDGYAPGNVGLGEGGDYLEFDIDIGTGKIVNFPSKQKIIQALTD